MANTTNILERVREWNSSGYESVVHLSGYVSTGNNQNLQSLYHILTVAMILTIAIENGEPCNGKTLSGYLEQYQTMFQDLTSASIDGS